MKLLGGVSYDYWSRVSLPYLHCPHDSGPIQWARGDVGLKPSAAARPWALAGCEWRAVAPRAKAPLLAACPQVLRWGSSPSGFLIREHGE